ncbi:hypothetical protein L6164_018252 [Bauhinia variegata]|uniref:Uncharacterized protein n=1 Tax=Bauhinia variegata TaxID=167791 RepID=A0ACB9NB69_BAUVA|nr:hypothetical protein L6164_018252 [Bauhinia variegata]
MSLNDNVSVMSKCVWLLLLATNVLKYNITVLPLNIERRVGTKADGDEAAECEKSFVQITQDLTGTVLPSGAKVFSVQIINLCPRDCPIAKLHVSCGDFKSEIFIPSGVFTRVGVNDCLVNGGNVMGVSDFVAFDYANIVPFPLEVSSLQCLA